jgi:hypothetical protein
MKRLLALALLVAIPRAAHAVNPCRAACIATRHTCRATAAASFVTAKGACPAPPDRRACVLTARGARTTARQACGADFRACKASCAPGGGPTCGSPAGTWLDTVNFYRRLAGLGPVSEDPTLSAGDLQHAEYMVKSDRVEHAEDMSSPFYTPAGDAAGQASDVAGHSANKDEVWAVEAWMEGPFHSIGILDPKLAQSGFGIAHDTSGTVQTAAALDVIRGRAASVPAGVQFPVVFPADGMVLPLNEFPGNEFPDPLASCPGYAPPAGLPLLVQLGTGTTPPAVSAHTLTRDGVAVEHCLFDGTTYANPDASMQALGRNVLGSRDAIVMIARQPLQPGTYAASITTGGQTIAWSFVVNCR